MADKSMTAKLILDASSYKQGIDLAKQATQTINKEMDLWKIQNNATNDSLKTLSQQARANSETQKILSAEIDLTKQKLKEVTDAQGETSKAAMTYQNKLLDLEIQQTKLNKEIGGGLTPLQNFQNGLIAAGDKMKNVGEKMASVGKNMSMYITAPILALGTATVKMAMDAVESENLFEVSMGNNAKAAREWSVKISDALGLNEYAIRKNVATFNVMFESMKIGSDKALEMSEGLTQLSYDMASFYNLSAEEAFRKLQSGISGEIEPLKQLGIVITEASVKTFAYKNHIARMGQELTEVQKVLARYGLIMEATSKAQGDLARTAESPANQLRRLKESATELAIKFGETLLPVFVTLMNLLNPIITLFSKLSEADMRFLAILLMIVAAIGPIVAIVGNVTKAVGGFSSFLGAFNIAGMKTTVIILSVVAGLIALAAIIAVIMGKSSDLNSTMQNIGSSVGNMSNTVNGAGKSVGNNASGTNNWRGGLTRINENGGEIIDAPNGTRIIPHDVSMEMARNVKTTTGNSGQRQLIINFNGPVYGVLDFEQRVKQIVRDAGADGAFRGVF
jgi:hypothetical protein